MSDIVKSSLTALIAGERPSPSAIQACFTAIMDGDVGEAQMAAFLIALKMRGEQVDDIAAAASVMRNKALTIQASDDAMDIVGTGGDGFGTYNISTASAFVIAGCGIPVPNMAIRPCRQKAVQPMFYRRSGSSLIAIWRLLNAPWLRPILPF